ncbi:hypothetical protein [Rhodopila sp.]|uniref:hypothetical protein n=1 Tax=Rhodopila sp. TaxID=2480087 RepID=UPI003D0E7F43
MYNRAQRDELADKVRRANILNEFQPFDPALIVPRHGGPGTTDIALDLASHIEAVGRRVRALRSAGQSVGEIIRDYKPRIIAAPPDWQHPGLIDWDINYFAAQPA